MALRIEVRPTGKHGSPYRFLVTRDDEFDPMRQRPPLFEAHYFSEARAFVDGWNTAQCRRQRGAEAELPLSS
jgi:hypothetical protein